MATSETTVPTGAAPKRRWLKKLLFVFAGLIVLLVIAWFVLTSEAFFKGSILPRIGKAMNATLTADAASISPFSQVTLRGVKLQTTGTEPLLTVTELRARYSLTAMLGGNIKVDEVLIDSPVVTVIESADGTRNTDALSQSATPGAKEPKPASSGASKPPQVDLKQFNLKNATVRYIRNYAGGTRDLVEINGINITLNDVKNGAAGKLDFALAAKAELNPPDAAQRGSLQLKHDGKYTFALGPDLMPTQITGSDRTDVTQASGVLADLADAGVDMVADMTPTEIKAVTLTFRKATTALGELRVSGPFDAVKREGKLNLTLSGVDHKLLNMAGGVTGMDFGSTTLNASNLVEIANGGSIVAIAGRLGLRDFQVTRANQTTPKVEFSADYAVAVDTTKSVTVLQSLNLNAQQSGRPLLKADLLKPMTIAPGSATNAAAGSVLNLNLQDLNLAEWKALAGTNDLAGTIGLSGTLRSDGVLISTEMTGTFKDIALDPMESYSCILRLRAGFKLKPGGFGTGGQLTVGNLVRRMGTNTPQVFPGTVVDFTLTSSNDVFELERLLLAPAPTSRAHNELLVTGRVDMSKPDAITGNLKLNAGSVDVTPYYDLFTEASAPRPAAAGSSTPADAGKEPEAMTLPFRGFTVDATIGRLYLREIEITNLLAGTKLDGGKVSVKPLECVLNGAPVKGSLDLNLGVPGFQYEFTFDASQVPMAPLVNSYQPERKGQIAGTATATAQLKGAGVTGANLQKNLTGQFDLVATNLNLSMGNVRTPVIKAIINIVAGIPNAIRNPTAAVGNLLGGLLGAKNESGGVMDDLMKSPVNAIVAHGTAGDGKIELKQAFVESPAFRGEATGAIDIATVLSNSVMHFPVSVSLGKAVSDNLGLSPANTPTNAVYVPLPDFVKMKGTLGLPKPDVNYLVIAKLALKSGGGILGNTGGAATEKVGGALGAVESLLGGQKQSTTTDTNSIPTTNTPTANPAGELIRGLGGLLGGQKKPAPTNPPAPPNP